MSATAITRRLMYSFCLLVVMGVLARAGAAQAPATPQTPAPKDPAMASRLLHVQIVTLRPGTFEQYAAIQKSEVIPALQRGGSKGREAWQTAVFGTTGEYAFVSEVDDMGQYDKPNPVRAALGEAGYQAYIAKVAPLTTGTRSLLIQTRPDLSFGTSNPSKLAIITNVQVIPNKQSEFEAFVKNEFVPVLKKAQVKRYSVARVILGGSTTEYVTLLTIENFAELAKGHPINRVLGEEGGNKLMARAGALISSADRRVIRLNEELSFRVGATSQVR